MMHHHTTRQFWECYATLPVHVRVTADKNYELLKADANHPSLHLKKAGKYWSVRVGSSHRALGLEIKDGFLWFWIGSHAEYDQIIYNQ